MNAPPDLAGLFALSNGEYVVRERAARKIGLGECSATMSDHRPLNFDDLGYPTADTVRRADETERILQDLIAELREAHDLACDGCGDGYPCSTGDAYGRAEARLREVQGE